MLSFVCLRRHRVGSIMDNIAEGFERGSRLEFVNALGIAKGETGELKSQLYKAPDAGYLTQELFDELYGLVDEIAKIDSFVYKLPNKSILKRHKFKDRI